MRTCFSMDPTTFDPRKNGDVITSSFLFMLYEGLARLLPSGEAELTLAESYQVSPDGLIYTFHLRKAYWTDGRPITAHDFEYSWKSLLDPSFSAPCKQLFFPILNAELASEGKVPTSQVGVQSVDDRTLRIHLIHPMPHFLSLVSFCNFYPIPKHIETNLSRSSFGVQPHVTSGPFRLARWERGKEILVYKNPLYWDVERVQLSSIQISIVNNEFTILDMFENDELDWVSSILSPSSLRKYRADERLALVPIGATVFSAFNTEQFPFHNGNIRKAFSLAIDRNHIVEQVTQMREAPANRLIPPILDPFEYRTEYDPKQARAFLRKGLLELKVIKEEESDLDTDDLKVRLFLSHLILSFSNDEGQTHRDLAHSLQKQWREVLGFRVKLHPQPFKTQMEQISKGDFNIALRFCAANYNDPMNILERFKYKHLARNFSRYESAEYIELLNRASQTQDIEKRNEILRRAEGRLLDDCPLFPIHHVKHPVLAKPSVSGIEISPIGSVHFRRAKGASQIRSRTEAAVS